MWNTISGALEGISRISSPNPLVLNMRKPMIRANDFQVLWIIWGRNGCWNTDIILGPAFFMTTH